MYRLQMIFAAEFNLATFFYFESINYVVVNNIICVFLYAELQKRKSKCMEINYETAQKLSLHVLLILLF